MLSIGLRHQCYPNTRIHALDSWLTVLQPTGTLLRSVNECAARLVRIFRLANGRRLWVPRNQHNNQPTNQQNNQTTEQLKQPKRRSPSPSTITITTNDYRLPTATIYHHWSKLCIPSVLTLQQPCLPVCVQSTLRTFWWQIKHHITYKHLCVYLLRFYLRVLLLGPID